MTTLLDQFTAIKLEPLCPVHIGTGDTLDPTSYVMRKEDDGFFLYYVDLTAWMMDHPDPEALAREIDGKPLQAVRKMLSDQVDPEVYATGRARVVTKGIFDKYRRELGSRASESQLFIDPGLKNPLSGALLIPGSSIKGAIRTAVIDYLDREHGLNLREATRFDGKGSSRNYNARLESVLGGIMENAFKSLKVGDFEAPAWSGAVVSANEVRRRDDKAGTPKSDCEGVPGRVMDIGSPALFGRIEIGSRNPKALDVSLTLSKKRVRKSWTLQELMDLVNAYYVKRFLEESEKFYKLPHLSATAEALKAIQEDILHPGKGEMILRVGHYSHVECMTVTDNEPKTLWNKKTNKPYPHGTTRTLADNRYPFGWVKLSICDFEEYQAGLRAKQEHDRRLNEARKSRRAERIRGQERLAREAEEKARREDEERKAEERRQAELAAMSEEDRLLHLVETGQASENQVVELYKKLDSLEEDQRAETAKALKAWWQNSGKWSGERTDKQKDKVAKVKGILGE